MIILFGKKKRRKRKKNDFDEEVKKWMIGAVRVKWSIVDDLSLVGELLR